MTDQYNDGDLFQGRATHTYYKAVLINAAKMIGANYEEIKNYRGNF
jgi:hypothetical protein